MRLTIWWSVWPTQSSRRRCFALSTHRTYFLALNQKESVVNESICIIKVETYFLHLYSNSLWPYGKVLHSSNYKLRWGATPHQINVNALVFRVFFLNLMWPNYIIEMPSLCTVRQVVASHAMMMPPTLSSPHSHVYFWHPGMRGQVITHTHTTHQKLISQAKHQARYRWARNRALRTAQRSLWHKMWQTRILLKGTEWMFCVWFCVWFGIQFYDETINLLILWIVLSFGLAKWECAVRHLNWV